jgi:hypothetical protein
MDIVKNLSDREILLLTYQKLEGVEKEFGDYKKESTMNMHELDKRISEIEKHLTKSDVLKDDAEKRSKRQLVIVGLAITVINALISLVIKFYS